MADVLTPEQRQNCMSSVRRENTSPEIILRSVLHKSGLRYRLHDKDLPGSPDMVFTRFRAVIFVHGCFWHSHGCYKSSIPESRHSFWKSKFQTNRDRDERNIKLLHNQGWRVMVVWQCALNGKHAYSSDVVVSCVKDWLQSSESFWQIPEFLFDSVT